MKNISKYQDMVLLGKNGVLNRIENTTMLLPDIQREYVWGINDIEKLFESITDDYPIGSFIFWKTNKNVINENNLNMYYFLRNFREKDSSNEEGKDVYTTNGEYYIVLDGQQRITSLNIALNGSYSVYKGGKGHSRKDPSCWVEKELYYNLDFYEEKITDEFAKRFEFKSLPELETGNYYKVKNILKYNKIEDLKSDLKKEKYTKNIIDDLILLYKRLFSLTENKLIHYYCITASSYDDALDVFVRINSTGKKLSKPDLMFSTLINGWSDGRKNIDNAIKEANGKGDGFLFTRDYLMRLALVLLDESTKMKIETLSSTTLKNIRDNWTKISKTFIKLAVLLSNLGLSNEFLTSYNATMPLAYYLYKGGVIKTSEEKHEAKKFLAVAMAKRLFGVASNESLVKTREVLQAIDCKKTMFTVSLFKNLELNTRTFKVTDEDIDKWLDTYEKGPNTYTLLSLLYPNLRLSLYEFHQDHCHPYSSFETSNISYLGLDDKTIEEWKKKRNLLPNLQFMRGDENKHKNKTPLKDWKGEKVEYLPKKVSLELIDFEDFFDARRELMRKELKKIFK